MNEHNEVRFEDFIMIMKHSITDQYADQLVLHIDYCEKIGLGRTRQQVEGFSAHEKSDCTVFVEDSIYEFPANMTNSLCKDFLSALYNNFAIYENKFSIIKSYGNLNSFYTRLQKTRIGQGYHLWHDENSNREFSNRIVAWMIYLNDVHEGGETEFLYYSKRIKPTKGTLLIWPAGFTHVHRGNPPISNDKYIATGWFEI